MKRQSILSASVAALFIFSVLFALPSTSAQSQRGAGRDQASASARAGAPVETLRHGIFRVEKRKVKTDGSLEAKPYEVKEVRNAYVNTGGALLLDLLIGAGGTVFNASNAHLGAGDSSTATAASHTDLQAASNKLRKAMDSTYPSRSGQVLTFRATFGSSEANYAWNEVAIFNASSSGTMLARTAQSFGTKASGTSWTLSYTITVP